MLLLCICRVFKLFVQDINRKNGPELDKTTVLVEHNRKHNFFRIMQRTRNCLKMELLIIIINFHISLVCVNEMKIKTYAYCIINLNINDKSHYKIIFIYSCNINIKIRINSPYIRSIICQKYYVSTKIKIVFDSQTIFDPNVNNCLLFFKLCQFIFEPDNNRPARGLVLSLISSYVVGVTLS